MVRAELQLLPTCWATRPSCSEMPDTTAPNIAKKVPSLCRHLRPSHPSLFSVARHAVKGTVIEHGSMSRNVQGLSEHGGQLSLGFNTALCEGAGQSGLTPMQQMSHPEQLRTGTACELCAGRWLHAGLLRPKPRLATICAADGGSPCFRCSSLATHRTCTAKLLR